MVASCLRTSWRVFRTFRGIGVSRFSSLSLALLGTFRTDHGSALTGDPAYEATLWEYSFSVPQDVQGLIEKMGGRETFIKRLDKTFDNNLANVGNEPSFLTAFLVSCHAFALV